MQNYGHKTSNLRANALLWLGLGLLLASIPLAYAKNLGEKAPYTFGVFPHLPPSRLQSLFAPVADKLSADLHRPVRFLTKSTFSKFGKELNKQRYDIALVQPFDYVRIHAQYGYLPLVRREKDLHAIIVALPSKPYRNIEDLRAKKIALPPKDSAVSYLVRAALRKVGLIPGKDVRLKYTRSHFSCMQRVMFRLAHACGTVEATRGHFKVKMEADLRVLLTTDSIPPPLFIIHPRIPTADRQQIEKTLLGLSTRIYGEAKEGEAPPRIVPAQDSEYDVVRQYIAQER